MRIPFFKKRIKLPICHSYDTHAWVRFSTQEHQYAYGLWVKRGDVDLVISGEYLFSLNPDAPSAIRVVHNTNAIDATDPHELLYQFHEVVIEKYGRPFTDPRFEDIPNPEYDRAVLRSHLERRGQDFKQDNEIIPYDSKLGF
jgi:hypothetical protein